MLRLKASISLGSVGCCFFFFPSFLVDCGCGSVGFDLDRLGFSGSLVGFDDLAADWVMIWLDWVSVNHCCGRSVNHCCCDCCCVVVVVIVVVEDR